MILWSVISQLRWQSAGAILDLVRMRISSKLVNRSISQDDVRSEIFSRRIEFVNKTQFRRKQIFRNLGLSEEAQTRLANSRVNLGRKEIQIAIFIKFGSCFRTPIKIGLHPLPHPHGLHHQVLSHWWAHQYPCLGEGLLHLHLTAIMLHHGQNLVCCLLLVDHWWVRAECHRSWLP